MRCYEREAPVPPITITLRVDCGEIWPQPPGPFGKWLMAWKWEHFQEKWDRFSLRKCDNLKSWSALRFHQIGKCSRGRLKTFLKHGGSCRAAAMIRRPYCGHPPCEL